MLSAGAAIAIETNEDLHDDIKEETERVEMEHDLNVDKSIDNSFQQIMPKVIVETLSPYTNSETKARRKPCVRVIKDGQLCCGSPGGGKVYRGRSFHCSTCKYRHYESMDKCGRHMKDGRICTGQLYGPKASHQCSTCKTWKFDDANTFLQPDINVETVVDDLVTPGIDVIEDDAQSIVTNAETTDEDAPSTSLHQTEIDNEEVQENPPQQLTEPTISEFSELTKDELSAMHYAIELKLLPDYREFAAAFADRMKYEKKMPNKSLLMPPINHCSKLLPTGRMCKGWITGPTIRTERGANRIFYSCSSCGNKKTIRCGSSAFGGKHDMTFFSYFARKTNYPLHSVLKLMWSVLYGYTFEQAKLLMMQHQLDTTKGCLSTNSYYVWNDNIRESGIFPAAFRNAQPMGGKGCSVHVHIAVLQSEPATKSTEMSDERYLIRDVRLGNNNEQIDASGSGLWIMGLLEQKADGVEELRCFKLDKIEWSSIGAVLERHISPGSLIICSTRQAFLHNMLTLYGPKVDWACQYQNSWIDTGNLDLLWLRRVYGTPRRCIHRLQFDIFMAYFWWRSMHKQSPFIDFCKEVAKLYPVD